jgi:hypothetical protein
MRRVTCGVVPRIQQEVMQMAARFISSMREHAVEACRDERGQGFAEYAFALAFVVGAGTAILASVGLQSALVNGFTAVGNALLAAV